MASLFAGTGNEYFRLAGCSEVYNFIGFAALLADLSLCCLPVHEPNYSMVGTEIGKSAATLCISAVSYCLPALLSLSGMKNGIEWLGFYPLFHAAALWQNQGYTADGEVIMQCGFRFFWYAQHSSSHGRLVRPLLTIMT